MTLSSHFHGLRNSPFIFIAYEILLSFSWPMIFSSHFLWPMKFSSHFHGPRHFPLIFMAHYILIFMAHNESLCQIHGL